VDDSLSDRKSTEELTSKVTEGLAKFEKSAFKSMQKLWILHHLPSLAMAFAHL